MTDWNKWLKKRELCADNILYVYRRDRKTIIHREDGKEFELFAPVYTLLALFPEDAFLNINSRQYLLLPHCVFRCRLQQPPG